MRRFILIIAFSIATVPLYIQTALSQACTSSSQCDDSNPCTRNVCARGKCTFRPGNRGTVCRAKAGACDLPERCTGTSASCPADTFRPATYTCRASGGVCDTAERCTGSIASCPSDLLKPADTVCRSAVGVCDVAETCTGTSASCPSNTRQPAGTICRAAVGNCDLAESCSGRSNYCPANLFRPATYTCRESAGACDVAETCTGTSVTCPGNAFRSSTMVCRISVGTCDATERCSGRSASCPADPGLTTLCADGDGCCPVGCDANNDDDCTPPICGDEIIDAGEQCDGTNLGGLRWCSTFGNFSGVLGCTSSCRFDTGACVIPVSDPYATPIPASIVIPETGCGNYMIDGSELCDSARLGGRDCTSFGYLRGYLGCRPTTCDGFNTTGCHGLPGDPYGTFSAPTSDPYYTPGCGSGFPDEGEFCDASRDGSGRAVSREGSDCTDFGYLHGNLGCTDDCSRFDTSRCYTVADPDADPGAAPASDPYYTPGCRSGFLDPGEECDRRRETYNTFLWREGPAPTCADFGCTGGTARCGSDCRSVTGCYRLILDPYAQVPCP